MSVIKQLDENLANKIAAGEVVEKCASVVKELVENSIDAKSTEIIISLKESGTKEIKVMDNGIGMDKEDAILCFNRHATIKIQTVNDLYHINTLGFRGEALASIASVSRVTLITCQDEVGTEVNIEGGKIIDIKNADGKKGTLISVRDLFYNTPARLKYLKSLYTELANIVELINKIALSHPDIRFTLSNDDKVLLKTDGSNNLLKVINAIYGINVTKGMIEVSSSNNDYTVSGFISKPEINKTSRNSMVTIVNGRVVRNQDLNRKINDAYHSYKPDNRYPIVVLNISVDESLVDVNIHPTKLDIKFSNQEDLFELVFKMIRDSITKKTLIPNADILKHDTYFEKRETEPKEKVIYEDIKLDLGVSDDEFKYQDTLFVNDDFSNKNDEIVNDVVLEEEKEDIKEENSLKFPRLEAVGLVHGTYIIAQNEEGMYLIDEHAAKERINYEIVKEKLASNNESVPLLIPLTLEFSNSEFITLKENLDFIREYGFDIDEFGVSSIIVKAHPTWIPSFIADDLIKRFLESVILKEKKFDLKKFNDHMAATMACKMSIKANTNITIDEMNNLLNDLSKCNNPFNCPHGRPTLIKFTTLEIEKMFKRTGF